MFGSPGQSLYPALFFSSDFRLLFNNTSRSVTQEWPVLIPCVTDLVFLSVAITELLTYPAIAAVWISANDLLVCSCPTRPLLLLGHDPSVASTRSLVKREIAAELPRYDSLKSNTCDMLSTLVCFIRVSARV